MGYEWEYRLLKEATSTHQSTAVRHRVRTVHKIESRKIVREIPNLQRYDLRHSWRLDLVQATKESD
jgi:hypothetical protein